MNTRRTRERNRNLQDFVVYNSYYDAIHQEDYKLHDDMSDHIAFASKDGIDVFHYGQAMMADDENSFVEAMVKEVEDYVSRKHWGIMPVSNVPKGHLILDTVWSFKRKRDIVSQKVIKWKVILTVYGGQQRYRINFWDTYSPVVNWFSVRLLLTLALVNKWVSRRVDSMLVFPQAPLECDLYMRLPVRFDFEHGNLNTHILKLKKNLYGQKQAGKIWFDHLSKGFKSYWFYQDQKLMNEYLCVELQFSCVMLMMEYSWIHENLILIKRYRI